MTGFLYDAGDKVVVRRNLIDGDAYHMVHLPGFVEANKSHIEMSGKVLTIERRVREYSHFKNRPVIDHWYFCEESNEAWTEDMFIGVVADFDSEVIP